MNKPTAIWFLILFAFLSTGCSSITKPEQPAVLDSVVMDESLSIGQTFVAQFDGMNGIEVYLEPQEIGDGKIQLILRENPHEQNLGRASLSMREISAPGYYHFPLPTQTDSNQQNYYLILKMKGSGSFKVGTAPGNTYLNGALYQNNQPNDKRQMAFQLSYYLPQVGIGLWGEIITWGWYLFVAGFLFVVPGWALLSFLWPVQNQEHTEENCSIKQQFKNRWGKLIISTGVSLAIYPIIFVWCNLVGLHIGQFYAWLPPLFGCAVLIWLFLSRWKKEDFELKFPAIKLVDVILLIILLLIIVTRFWVIRSLAFPMWGDSYHHTLITQLLIDNQGLFESWKPYTDAATFTYHFGFHAAVSVFHWATNISATQSTLIVGQIINIISVLALYPLAILVFKNQWSGVVALLVAGLLSPMPMFYVNWGRYTQLAGQVVLLIAIWFTWILFKSKNHSWRSIALTSILVSGLAMTHYRVIIFYSVFVIAFIILKLKNKKFIPILKRTLWFGIGAGVIFLPWFLNVFRGQILSMFRYTATNVASATDIGGTKTISYSIGNLTDYLPITLWLLAIIVLAICIWQKKLSVAIISLWWFILVLVANPHWIGYPGGLSINNFTVFIAAYIPVSLILAVIPTWWIPSQKPFFLRKKMATISLAFVICALGFWGSWQRHSAANPLKFSLAAEPDIRAAAWIQDNISRDANFLVNTFLAFNEGVIVGSDGGWWLPLIANRQTMLPPITYIFESEPTPGYNQWVQIPTRMIQSHGITHPETISTLIEHEISHVYIGQQQGSVNYNGLHKINPTDLLSDKHFELLYQADRIWIFEIQP